MSQIVELSETLANQIAAGEVVERPASVIKELIENAIDAGSSQIAISVEEAGLKSITITDNGEGIAYDEVSLALKRHATSKLKKPADLFRIRTLGFRGEALPSIASVSHLTIETAQENSLGKRLVAKGGKIEEETDLSRPKGTTVCVSDLFYNTPARLKFIKSQQAELSHIVDVVNRQSLAHPEIAITLSHDGHGLTTTNGQGDLKQTISGVYGLATAKKMVAVFGEGLDMVVSGFVSLPELTRSNRNYISIFVNERYIKNFLLNRAILDGYGSKLMVGRFPIVVLNITLDPHLADVNVHPTKQEVRLSKEKEIMSLITQAISESLREQDLIPDALENLAKSSVNKGVKPVQGHLNLEVQNLYYDPSSQAAVAEERKVFESMPDFGMPEKELASSQTLVYAKRQEQVADKDHPNIDNKNMAKVMAKLDQEAPSNFPNLEYFGQMYGTYLFAQGREGLFIIDQHAAQERIKYEYYREHIDEVDSSLQQLLVPYLFEFPANDLLALEEKKEHLVAIGIHLEPFGERQLILREHPVWMAEDEVESAVYELCDMLLLTDEASIKTYRHSLAVMMSCKRSIKANHSLDDQSARHLLQQLATCKNPYNCPHGRPVLVHFSPSDMEKMFRRIQENHSSIRDLGKY